LGARARAAVREFAEPPSDEPLAGR